MPNHPNHKPKTMDRIDKYKLMSTLIRSFFESYTSGIIDCHVKNPQEKFNPQTIKKIMLEHYEQIAPTFHEILLYPVAAMNFSFEEIEEILTSAQAKDIQDMTGLFRRLCVSEELHNALVAEYRRNFGLLLNGRFASIPEHLKSYTQGTAPAGGVETEHAIRLAVRTVMKSYARGIRHAGTGKSSLHQASVFRLLLDAMTTLLCDRPLSQADADKGGLNALFMKACRSQPNIDVMTDEMEIAYNQLVQNEGIISHDDKAN